MMLGGEARCIGIGPVEFNIVRPRQLANELRIGVGFRASDAVMEMDEGKNDSQFLASFHKTPQQGHGVRSARNSHAQTVARLDEAMFADVAQQLGKH